MKLQVYLACATIIAARECEKALEIVQVQDASYSYEYLIGSMVDSTREMLQRLTDEFKHVKFGLSSFVDKPSPYRGLGNGRGVQHELDFCYAHGNPLTTDPMVIEKGFRFLSEKVGSGGDYIENPYEGMIYGATDPKMGFTDPRVVYDEEGRHILRILIAVTDDLPHYAGDAASGINSYNAVDPNDYEGELPVVFYHEEFIYDGAIFYTPENLDRYAEMLVLHKKKTTGSDLTDGEKLRFSELMAILGPDHYAAPKEHDGAFDHHNKCEEYEYPTLEKVAQVFERQSVLPVIIVSPPQFVSSQSKHHCEIRGFGIPSTPDELVECLVKVYEQDLKDMNVPHAVVSKFDGEASHYIQELLEVIYSITRDVECPDDPPPTLAPTSPPIGSHPQDGKPTTSPPGNGENPATEDGEPGAFPPGGPGVDTGDKPPSKDGESNIGVIAGATGGAIAGAAALGLAAAKAMGLGGFGNATPDMVNIEQVDMPDNSVARETLEEVTMDMFQ